MSIKYESLCVGCAPDLPCMGSSCSLYAPSPVILCDVCENSAEYRIDGSDLCEECAKDYLTERFRDYPIREMAQLVDADFSYAVDTYDIN